jgi:hypothetical protein
MGDGCGVEWVVEKHVRGDYMVIIALL